MRNSDYYGLSSKVSSSNLAPVYSKIMSSCNVCRISAIPRFRLNFHTTLARKVARVCALLRNQYQQLLAPENMGQ
jgi:hypothetical protein